MKKALISGITGQDGSFLAEFLLQNDLHIARYAARELVTLANRLIKRFIFIGIHASYDTGENLRRIAQHIDVRIVYRLEKKCRTTMDMHTL